MMRNWKRGSMTPNKTRPCRPLYYVRDTTELTNMTDICRLTKLRLRLSNTQGEDYGKSDAIGINNYQTDAKDRHK